MTTIEIKDLSIGYTHAKRAVPLHQHLSATIHSGELTCLVGSNGIGKSTLLRTLAAFQPPLAGDILIDGRPIHSFSYKELAQIIGVVLTEKTEVRDLSVTELIGMGRSPYTGFWGVLNKTDQAIVKEAIEWVHIEHLSDQPVHTLSDGERQKVMIAKVLAQQTPVIFLDEPTAFLDFPSKVEIMRLLHRLTRKMHKIIFLSTHDLELALQIADQLWLMDQPTGITVGTPEMLTSDGRLEHFFQCEGVVFDRTSGLFRINKVI